MGPELAGTQPWALLSTDTSTQLLRRSWLCDKLIMQKRTKWEAE